MFELDFLNFEMEFWMNFGHILNANDMKYEASYKSELAIFHDLKGTKTRGENTAFLPFILLFRKTRVFISRLGAFKMIKLG
jgi:hypothetical protein